MTPQTTVFDVVRLMLDKRISGPPVVDDHRLVLGGVSTLGACARCRFRCVAADRSRCHTDEGPVVAAENVTGVKAVHAYGSD